MLRVTLFIALFALAAAASLSLDSQWESFKEKYDKSYKSAEEEAYRKSIFAARLEMINAHNEKADNGEISFKLGVNEFSDLTSEEFEANLGMKSKLKRNARSTSRVDSEWESFKAKYGKSYKSASEETYRKSVFAAKLEKINAHNEKAANGEVTYRLGVNKFSDLTSEEFKAKHLGFKPTGRRSAPLIHNANYSAKAPASVDWRTKGIVSEVKDQASCGSCWAFSAIAAIEGANAQKTGKLVELSEQNLMDCSWKYGDEGCNGGLMDDAFAYVKANKGVDTEKSYPYVSGDGQDSHKCKYSSKNKGASISSYVDVPQADEKSLLSAVAERVVSVAIDATAVQDYDSGILDTDECSSDPGSLNHGVAVVGYGTENGTPYWIVKNSWSSYFGEDGYFRLVRNKNMCGLADSASYPIV